MDSRLCCTVINLLDDRTASYHLPPDLAVVAAFEEHESGFGYEMAYLNPRNHPCFKE